MSETENLLDQLPIGIFRLSGDLREVFINKRMAEYLGTQQGRIYLNQIDALGVNKEGRDQWLKVAQLALAKGGPQHTDFDLDTPQGTRRINMRVTPERDSSRRIIGLIGVTVDITEQHQASLKLAEAERRFHMFMDHTPVIAWIKDHDSRYVYRNKSHRDRFGSPGEDWTGRHDREFFPSAASRVYSDTDRHVLETGVAAEFESANRDRQGSNRQWWIQKFPVRDAAGRTFVGGVGIDITDRKALEQRLRESEARFQAFLDHSPALAWMKDEAGRYQFISRSYREFLGLAESDNSWRGRTDHDYFTAEFAEASALIEREVLAANETRESVGPARDKLGKERQWLLVRFPFTDHDGRRFIGGVATDVTVHKRAEEVVRLQSLTDELTGLYNRRGFHLLVEQEYRHARRKKLPCALMLVDLDGLKLINDTHGHDLGDEAIVNLGEVLRVAVRDSDIVARIGGDEFIVFAVDCKDVGALRQRVLGVLEEYNQSQSLPFRLAASVGVAESDAGHEHSFETLMRQADAQMYAIKRARQSADPDSSRILKS